MCSITSRCFITPSAVKKNVTFVKIDQVSEAIGVHPITIMTAAYRLCDPETSLQELLARVEREMAEVDL